MRPYTLWSRGAASVAQSSDSIASLKDVRSVIRVSGPDLIHFLQGLITNDVSPLAQPTDTVLYSCILNAQGRYLHDMFLHRTPATQYADNEPTILMDTDSKGLPDMLRLLKRYRLRQQIDIDDVSSEYGVWSRWNPTTTGTSSSSSLEKSAWKPDPRLPVLGHRAVVPHGNAEKLLGVEGSGSTTSPWKEYRRHRIRLGVAEGDSEIPSGAAIPYRFCIDGLNAISFNKGCYVGQELMARTRYVGVVRKRIMPFKVQAPLPPNTTIEDSKNIYDGLEATKSIGEVHLTDGDDGLAMIRLAETMSAMDAGKQLYVEYVKGDESSPIALGRVPVKVIRPDWWPETWGREELQA